MAVRDYVKFIRFKYHHSFLVVVLGALLFSNSLTSLPSLLKLLQQLLMLYVSFNILLLGGLYTLNDIADAKSDEKHPLKKNRPIPSGRVSTKSALAFSLLLTTAGFASGYALFSRNIFYVYLAIFALNLFYTFVAKKVPYLELVTNSVTHPLRFLMGTLLGSQSHTLPLQAPYFPILALFLLYLGLACVRRIVEKDVQGWEARKTLRFYPMPVLFSIQLLSFLAILAITAIDASVTKALYLLVTTAYLILVFGIYLFKPVRKLFTTVWTRS